MVQRAAILSRSLHNAASRPLSESSPLASVVMLVINYGCDDEVLTLVRDALAQQIAGTLRVVVVENSPVPEQSPLWDIARNDARLFVCSPGRNLGYFGGAAWGLERYRETMTTHETPQPPPEWVIVSNPDIRFEDHHVLQRLCELHSEHPPSVVAPSIITAGGRDQNPHLPRRPRAMTIRMYASVYNYRSVARIHDAGSRVKRRLTERVGKGRDRAAPAAGGRRDNGQREIYAAHGAFLAFHRSFFESGGNLDYGAFLFGEELYVAETVRFLGGRISYDPRLKVLHGDHPTTRLPSNELLDQTRRSYRYLLNEYFRHGRDGPLAYGRTSGSG